MNTTIEENSTFIKQEMFENCFVEDELNNEESDDNNQLFNSENEDASFLPKDNKTSKKTDKNARTTFGSNTVLTITQEKAATFFFDKQGQPTFFQNIHRKDFSDPKLIPWQKAVTKELQSHFGYNSNNKVKFRISMISDKYSRKFHTYFLCPHQIGNKLAFMNPKLNSPLYAHIFLKCEKCKSLSCRTDSRPFLNERASNEASNEAVQPTLFSEATSFSYEPPVKMETSLPLQHRSKSATMSPQEFLYTISKECDRFKQSIIEKMENYFVNYNQTDFKRKSNGSKVKNENGKRSLINSDWEDSDDSDDDIPLKKGKKK